MTPCPGHLAPVTVAARIDANGTMWRLRSLVAMGHDCARIARALGVPPGQVRRVVRGHARTITRVLQATACQLWDAWWDKTPPQLTPAQRRAAACALRQAKANDWPAAAGLEEDLLDEPGYRPWCQYRPATGYRHRAGLPPGAGGPLTAHQGDRMTPDCRRAAPGTTPPAASPPTPTAPEERPAKLAGPDAETMRAELPADLSSARQARSAVRRALTAWRMDHLSADAELLASELVANAAEHGDGKPISLALRRHAEPGGRRGITCEVTDSSPAVPRRAEPGPGAERGRGLAIVAALAQSSGVRASQAGKTSWFTLALTDRARQAARQLEHEPEAGA